MENVKVTVAGKKGKTFEALVSIENACKTLFVGENKTNIVKMSYSVVHKCHNYLVGKIDNATEKAQLEKEIKPFFAMMQFTPQIALTNGVLLYRDE